MRFILFFGAFFVFYRLIKYFIFPTDHQLHVQNGQQPVVDDDVMVKDPYCQTFFLKREGVPLLLNGRYLTFCSSKCKDRYLDEYLAKHDKNM